MLFHMKNLSFLQTASIQIIFELEEDSRPGLFRIYYKVFVCYFSVLERCSCNQLSVQKYSLGNSQVQNGNIYGIVLLEVICSA